jgi:hypothetical protein
MKALYIVDRNKTGAERSPFNGATIRASCPHCITASSAMAATVTGAVFDVTNQGVEMFPLKNSFLEDVAIGDQEGQSPSVDSVSSMEEDLVYRIAGNGLGGFQFQQIRSRHGEFVRRPHAQAVFVD